MRVALDTNILVYAEGINGTARAHAARSAITALADETLVVPVQALGELFTVLTRKAGWSASKARAAVLSWQDACETVDTTSLVLAGAMELVAAHRLSFWDAVMLSAAAQGSCRILLSEDMHQGFIWQGVEVRNPFVSGG